MANLLKVSQNSARTQLVYLECVTGTKASTTASRMEKSIAMHRSQAHCPDSVVTLTIEGEQ